MAIKDCIADRQTDKHKIGLMDNDGGRNGQMDRQTNGRHTGRPMEGRQTCIQTDKATDI